MRLFDHITHFARNGVKIAGKLNCNGLWILNSESEILELNFYLNLRKLQADVDNSGTIDYGEFIAATVHLNKIEKQDHLFAAFSYFDKDGSGYITHDELQQACIEFGLDDTSLEDMIQEVDQDNVSSHTFASSSCCTNQNTPYIYLQLLVFQDGRIDYNEFVSMMQKGHPISAGVKRGLENSFSINFREALKLT